MSKIKNTEDESGNKGFKISMEELRKRKIFLAMPMYGGMCNGNTTANLMQLVNELNAAGLNMQPHFLFNESLITRARNYSTHAFLQSDCTHMMFIDADIGFKARDVISLLALQSENPNDDEYDIVAAPYPKKTIAWEKIKAAVDKGVADEDPNVLDNFVGDFVFNLPEGVTSMNVSAPVEVLESGTGFMMIRRNTFEKFKAAYPELEFTPDHNRSEDFNNTHKVHAYFDTVICPDTNRYLSEDYMFCQWARKIGLKTWLMPWIKLEHYGHYKFGGSMHEMLKIGQNPVQSVKR